MGNFYVNVTLNGPDRDEIAGHLRAEGYKAYVSPTVNGMTVVAEERCDSQDGNFIRTFTAKLSKQFGCPAFAILNHDDDVLQYWLFDEGKLHHEYNSSPNYFAEEHEDEDDDDAVDRPIGGDAKALCDALGCPGNVPAVHLALTQTEDDNSDLVFACERHVALLSALGRPTAAVGFAWIYLQRNEYLPGMSGSTVIEV